MTVNQQLSVNTEQLKFQCKLIMIGYINKEVNVPIFPDPLVPNVNWSTCNFAALVHCYLLQKHSIFNTAGKSCISATMEKNYSILIYIFWQIFCLKKSKIAITLLVHGIINLILRISREKSQKF